MKKILLNAFGVLGIINLSAQKVNVTESAGWLESAYVKWNPPSETVDSYNVYYSGNGITNKKIDTQLIRNYGSFFRADILGLTSGEYSFKVVSVVNGVEKENVVTSNVTVLPYDRNGFAHSNNRAPGAYNFDGTLKNDAVVLYVSEDNKNSISLNVTGANSNPCIGLQNILDGFKKGKDTRPLVVRLLGNVTDFSYMLNGDIVIENNNNSGSYITVEGVGIDAVANGWGVRIKNASNVEIRNLGFMLTDAAEGDNISLQQSNDYIWVHNNDLFYGFPGKDADQEKGDGALDAKKSGYITFSYNHFWDNGKSSLLGLSEANTVNAYATYHHNWFDHSDSRHPRVRTYTTHIYNNYYDGNSKYGIGTTMGASIFAESNYFRNSKYPMLISKQGSDIASNSTGTFSNEDGGIIKAFNNYIEGANSFLPYDASSNPIQFDAYVSKTRDEVLSSSIKALKGASVYNNFDTNSSFYVKNLIVDEPSIAKDKIMKYAGRVQGGDIKFTFDNSVDDKSYAVNQALMSLLKNYKSSLVYVQGIDYTPVSTHTLSIPTNNDQTVKPNTAIEPMNFVWGGTASDLEIVGLPANGIDFTKDISTKTLSIFGTPTSDTSFTVKTIGTGTPISATGTITIDTDETSASVETHNFTINGLSSKFYTFSGTANINSTDGTATYDELTFTKRLKIESATVISYTTKKKSTLTLVFDPSFNGKIKLNGVNYVAKDGIVIINDVPIGENKITKGDTANLYYIKTEFEKENLMTSEVSITNSNISIYPNPVQDKFEVRTNLNNKINKVTVLNTLGQIVKQVNNQSTIGMKGLKSGIYIVQIETDNGIETKKIIKK
ncbi:pectate lyase family protein [Empedobacter falsenii]|uniref:Pectate trisaccharide-lyase n=1 Tax=Empedobacter falsenii TaxID=343874 RepID=A0A376GF93_9FLAO|nr:T9SS type A sorting domain-containing protein [Empedobacter falsenii]STD59044.1 Pectate trisaccharide-lyase precursor [Empedobacter falsenii]